MLRRHSRIAISGTAHFVTTVTAVRGSWFTNPILCREILKVFEAYRNRHAVRCLGYVLMPDHLHVVVVQEGEDPSISRLMQAFKSLTSQRHKPPGYPSEPLWRTRYDDVPLPNCEAVRTRLEYMHGNPVCRGIASCPEEYPWSSARLYFGGTEDIVTISRFD
jgi:putative transposase